MKTIAFIGEYETFNMLTATYTKNNTTNLNVKSRKMLNDTPLKIQFPNSRFGDHMHFEPTHGADTIFICDDGNDPKFITHFEGHLRELRRISGNNNIILVANSDNISPDPEVINRFYEFAEGNGCAAIFCSARNDVAQFYFKNVHLKDKFHLIFDHAVDNTIAAAPAVVVEPALEEEPHEGRLSRMKRRFGH